jgi:DNA-binding response OmpR family regulator
MSEPKTILLVDDEPDIRLTLGMRLKKSGYAVITAENGKDALDKIEQQLPDLVILDVMMPEMNGYQVCRKLREKPGTKDLPILMLTAKDQAADRFWAEEAGVTEYFSKPFEDEELLLAVKRLVG